VYDMVKGVERGVEIRSLRLMSKSGGNSGEWHRPAGAGGVPQERTRPRPGDRIAGRIGRKRPG
jgi:cyclic pyranopterin phosphate synthase